VARGWLAFAAVFVVVLIGLGLLPLLTGPAQDVAETVPAPSTTAAAPTTTAAPTTVPEPACSASGIEAPPAQEGLPPAVAETRAAIAAASTSCDVTRLHELAGDLLTSFGGGDFSSIQEWEEAGEGKLSVLVQLLGTRYAVQEIEGEPDTYVWPAAFVYDSWDEIPAEDLAELTAIFGQEEMDLIAGFGSYAGWRVGITEDGDWRFFIAGD
jgi:hypothetical protein